MYKGMWQGENAGLAPPKSSCCGTPTLNEFRGAKGMPDVDFNLWTGELQRPRLGFGYKL